MDFLTIDICSLIHDAALERDLQARDGRRADGVDVSRDVGFRRVLLDRPHVTVGARARVFEEYVEEWR